MYPDLQHFRTLTQREVLQKLHDDGYAVIGNDRDSVVLARPEDDFVVRITSCVRPADVFARICRENEGNPYFPKIYSAQRIETDPPAFITVMERLLTLADLPNINRSVAAGGARALALLLPGHTSHDDVHALMLRDKKSPLFRAASGMVAALEDALQVENDTLVYYDSGFAGDDRQNVESWTPDNILFRRHGNGCQYVFSDPLREGRCSDPARRAGLAAEIAGFAARLQSIAVKEKDPAAGQGLPPKSSPAP